MFPNVLSEVTAGQTIEVHGHFTLPQSMDLTSSIVSWKLIDGAGVTYLSGNATSYNESLVGNLRLLDYFTNTTIPDTLPTTEVGSSYLLYWELTVGGQPVSTYNATLSVLPVIQDVVGGKDSFYLKDAPITIYSVLPANSVATLTVNYNNSPIYVEPVTAGTPTSNGYNFSHTITGLTPNPPVTLDPYICLWEQGQTKLVSKIWVVNPSIISAAATLMNACNRLNLKARLQELDFGQTDLFQWLKEGRDKFNSIGLISNFTMTNATNGPIIEAWIDCAKVCMLRSQYMTEALHSFQFSGQSTQLDVDLTQYYDNMANQIESGLEQLIPPMKRQLARKGMTGGDGSYYGGPGNVGAVGIAASYPNTRGVVGNAFIFKRTSL